MKVSVDISMYPLHKDFEQPIIEFIKKLRASKFDVEENGLSTQIFGEYVEVMSFVNTNMHEALTEDRSKHDPNY
jgi:uncharacterized protein YqgV (UPF0045/DUF77 family)